MGACEVSVALPGVDSPDGDLAWLSAMVDCEEEREKVFASGARCVSFSSMLRQPRVDDWERETAAFHRLVEGVLTLCELPRHPDQ